MSNNYQITKPTLILDKQRVLKNIARMADKAKKSDVFFRPHFKTHQSAEIGRWFMDIGITACTVSSVDMAQYFAENGWSDITIATSVNILELPIISQLADTINLGVLVDSDDAVDALEANLNSQVKVWIKIDTGYARTGIPWDKVDHVVSLTNKIQESSKLNFAGILTHNGLTYHEHTPDGIQRSHHESMSRMLQVKESLIPGGIENCTISIGDTPSCSVVDDFTGADEIRPGNFVFYDVMQTSTGVCSEDDIAVVVACPVIGTYAQRKEIVLYGGAIHFGKERILDSNGNEVFGYLSSGKSKIFGKVNYYAPIISLSQEYGIVRANDQLLFNTKIGDIAYVYPIHSCLTCGLYPEYLTLEGESIKRMRWMSSKA